MIAKKLVFLLFSTMCINLYAQHTLSGIITDENKQPLWGASVYIPDLYLGTSTNAEGYYEIKNIPKGVLKAQFSYIGYESEINSIEINESLVKFDTHLHKSVIEAHEVVVSTAYPSSQDENPVKVEQMTTKDLKKVGGIGLMQSIQTMPGVNIVSTGVGINKPVIRGLSYNRVLVYGMGTRIENQQWGDEHGLGLSDMGVERVEIIKGPSSLLYGSDAMGGVMHLIEEKPANIGTFVGDYNLAMNSNTQGYSTNLGIKTASKKLRFSLRAGTESNIDYIQGNGIRVSNSRFKGNAIKSSIGYTNHFISSTFYVNYISSLVGIPHGTDEQVTERVPEPSYQQFNTLITSLQNTLFFGKSKLKINLGYLANNRNEFEGEESHEGETEEEHSEHEGEAALQMNLKTINYDAKYYTPKTKLGEVIVGIQGMNQNNKNNGEEILIPDATINDIGISAMTKLEHNKLLIQAGLRYDIRSIFVDTSLIINTLFISNETTSDKLFYNSINGAFGATYKLSHSVLIRTNIASGYRAPNLAELTSNGVHHGTNRYEIGNMLLNSEQNIEFDLSSHLHTEHATADIASFYNYINNYIYLNPTSVLTEGFNTFEYTQDDAMLYGGEFTLDIHPHPLDWLHLRGMYSSVIGQKTSGGYLPLIPANKLNISANIEAEGNKLFHDPFFNFSWNYVFAKNNIPSTESISNSYSLFNLAIGTEISVGSQHISLSFIGNNLLDVAYYDHLSRLKSDNLYNVGRNFQVNLKVPFSIKK